MVLQGNGMNSLAGIGGDKGANCSHVDGNDKDLE